jgi:hypothetical protein
MAWELERDYPIPFRDRNALRTIAGVYPDIARHTEHGKHVSLPLGKLSVKIADSGAGKGGWSKLMLCCNDADTDKYLARK